MLTYVYLLINLNTLLLTLVLNINLDKLLVLCNNVQIFHSFNSILFTYLFDQVLQLLQIVVTHESEMQKTDLLVT